MTTRSLSPGHVVGVLSPLGNVTTQLEFEVLAPADVFATYSHFDFGERFADTLKQAALNICSFKPETILFSLSPELNESVDEPGAYLSRLRKLIEKRTQLPLITATEATIHALRTIGANSVGIIAPSPDENGLSVKAFYASEGISVGKFVGLARGLGNIRSTPAELIEEAFAKADGPNVDALVHIGTGLPVLGLIEKTEEQYRKPVIGCNSAMIWQYLRGIGYDVKMSGYGRLLRDF